MMLMCEGVLIRAHINQGGGGGLEKVGTWHPYCFNHFFHCFAGRYPNSKESVELVVSLLLLFIILFIVLVLWLRRGSRLDATWSMA